MQVKVSATYHPFSEWALPFLTAGNERKGRERVRPKKEKGRDQESKLDGETGPI